MDPNNNNPLKKRLYQNLLNKQPKQNNLLNSNIHSKSGILRPKISQQIMNSTMKKSLSPVFQHGKFKIDSRKMKSPQIPKKILPLTSNNKQKLSKQAKQILQQGKFKSKTNLKPHDIFAFYDAFPQMVQDFFYLNRIGHPYDYQIITYSQRNPHQYMTISSQGVTLYHDKQAQFMTKQQWLSDQKVYYSLQRIQFFKQYKISKNFTIWKNRMRRHYMKQMSNLLKQNLFTSFQHPRNCLLSIKNVTNIMKQSFSFLPCDIISSLNPNDFLSNILSYLSSIFFPKIKQVENCVSEQLQKAINEQIKKFKTQNNIKIQDVGDHDQKDHKQGYVYSQQAILRKQYKKVHKLIKLADNILLQGKIELIEKCITELIDKMQVTKDQDEKLEWITCTAFPIDQKDQDVQNNNKIIWNPNKQQLINIFKNIIFEAVNKISQKHQKISARDNFEKYKISEQVENRKDQKRNSLKYMIEQSSFYNSLIQKIQNFLQQQFKRTQKQQKQIIKFIDIYSKHKSLPSVKQIFLSHSSSQYCQLVREWKIDNQTMQLLPDNKSVGLLVFNYSQLRKKIISAPSQSLLTFLTSLPQQTSSKCRNLLHQSKILLQMILTYPTDIQSFVNFNKAVRTASQKLDNLLEQGKQVIQMVSLMQQNKLANLDIYKGRSKQAMLSINNLKGKVDQSNAKYDQSLSKFRKQLESSTTRVKSQVKDLINKFEVIPFDSIVSQIGEILEKLGEILPTIEELQKQSIMIQEIQNQLSLNASDFTQIHTIYSKSKIVHELWLCKKQWNQLLLQIYNKHYSQINCQQIKNKWQQFSTRCTIMQKQLYDNQVLKKLNLQINQFQNLIQTIIALTSKNLQQKSWRQISQYLAYQLNIQDQKNLPFSTRDDPQYTVQWLIKYNISLYKQKIIFIVQKSQKQKQLQTSLGQFKSYISSIVFQTIFKKRQVILIGENVNLKDNLKDKLNVLYTLIANQYSQTLKIQAETLIRHYEYIEEILAYLYQFRQDWEKYQIFFQTTSVSIKLLSKQLKEFSSWELQWKKIIKNITNDPVYFYKKVCDQTLGVNCSRGMIKTIVKANTLLDMVKKGFQQFMQKKRLQFPRYCLFTDQQLLTIISLTSTQQLINPDLVPILYQNLSSIQYQQQSCLILSATSKSLQKLPLLKQSTIKSQSQMQDLLKITQQQIKKTMSQIIRNVFNKYVEEQITRQQLIKGNILQVIMSVDFIAWVRLAEETYLVNQPIGTLHDWVEIQNAQIKQLTQLVNQSTKQIREKLFQFIVHCLYLREKTQTFTKYQNLVIEDYVWQRIPKMVMTSNQIFLKQLDNKIFYNFELLNQSDLTVIVYETQKVWVNLTNAISNKLIIGINGQCSQTVKDLAFYCGQSVKQIHISQQCNIKTFQRLLTGCLYIGSWLYFKPIYNQQILTYLTYHINISRRNSLQSTSSVQISKNSLFLNSLSTTILLFQHGYSTLIQKNLLQQRNFRNISLIQPDEIKILYLLCHAQNISYEIGDRLIKIIEFCRETFVWKDVLNGKFVRDVFNWIRKNVLSHFSQENIEDPEIVDFIIVTTVEDKLLSYFNDIDYQLFQSFKLSLIPNFLTLKAKLNNKITKDLSAQSIIQKYFKNKFQQKQVYFTKQYINQLIKAYNIIKNSNKIGLVVSGNILSGKSNLIKIIQQIHRYQLEQINKNLTSFKVFKIYPNCYQFDDIIKKHLNEKKQKKQQKVDKNDKNQKQKYQKSNDDLGLLQNFLKDQSKLKWIVFDGQLQKELQEIIDKKFDSILLPNYGTLNKQKHQRAQLQQTKLIIQTLTTSQYPPSIFYNYGICHISSSSLTVQSIVKSFFEQQSIKKYLKYLKPDTITYFSQQLISNLIKVQLKGNIKSKQIDFLYPFSQNEITLKALNLIECVVKMNQESLREKQKNMKKTIQKFVYWAILITLNLHVDTESQMKLEKKFTEITKCDGIFNDVITKYIVYPGSGIQVHPINGLRTQSSLFQIPQKGIITKNSKNDYNDFTSQNQKNTKFYQQISLQQISSIRVNYQQSNSFSYYAQLYAYSNRPIVIIGAAGFGKKSILDLYAKNIKHRSQIHSIRYHPKISLIDIYQKPFRKFSSLNGIILKSYTPNKNIVVFIQDISLRKKQIQALQFIRMLSNDFNFINKNGQLRTLTDTMNSLAISTCGISLDQTTLRLATKLTFYQTIKPSAEKFNSIFLPYLKAWTKANNLQGEIARIFSSQNGDNILDATIKVFEFMEENFIAKKNQENFSLQTILLKPRIGDISKVLSFICRTQDAAQYPLTYYSELWASQILRVFGDRISQSQKQINNQLMQLIKKQFFLKFKQNFVQTSKDSIIFSNILSQYNKLYQKIQDIDNLQQFIINLIQCQTITLPVRLFFNQLIYQIIKIYRIIQLPTGNIILFDLNQSSRQYLIQLACQIAQSNFISLKQNLINIEKDILPTLDKDQNVCIYEDIDEITDQQIYQFTCLSNRNLYQFDMKCQVREKVKNRLNKYFKNTIGQNNGQNNANNNNNINGNKETPTGSFQKQKYQNMKQKEMMYLNQKIQEDLQTTMQQVFMNNLHFIFGASPMNQKTKRFFLNQTDFVGEFHFTFFHIPAQSLHQISKQMLTIQQQQQQNQQKQKQKSQQQQKLIKQQNLKFKDKAFSKCIAIYNSLQQKDKNYNNLLCVCENLVSEKQKLTKQCEQRINELENCLKNSKKAMEIITENQAKLKEYLQVFQQIKKEQSDYSKKLEEKSNQISQLQLNVDTGNQNTDKQTEQRQNQLNKKNIEFQAIQQKIKQIKGRKDKNQQQSRQSRKIISVAKDYIQIIGKIQQIQQKLMKQQHLKQKIQNLLILWWNIICLQGHSDSQTILQKYNKWLSLIQPLNKSPTIQSIQHLLEQLNPILSPLQHFIPTLSFLPPQFLLKLLIFFFILQHQQQTILSNNIITIYDPSLSLQTIFKYLLSDDEIFGEFTFGLKINKYDEHFWTNIEKCRKGIVFLGNTIDQREKRDIQNFIQQRRIININRFIHYRENQKKAYFVFNINQQLCKNYLIHLNVGNNQNNQINDGQQVNKTQYNKINKKLRQLNPIFRKKCSNFNFSSQNDTAQLLKIKKQIQEYQKKINIIKQLTSKINIQQKDMIIIDKTIEQLFKNLNENITLQQLKKLYQIIRMQINNLVDQIQSQQNRQKINQQQTQPQTTQSSHIPTRHLSLISQLIHSLISTNFTSHFPISLSSTSLSSIPIFSLQLFTRIPIIILPNTLFTCYNILKQSRPLNLFISNNFSNLLIQSNEQKINHKFIVYYNDDIHFNMLIELVKKYYEEYQNNNYQKKYFIYLVVNTKINRLRKQENQNKKIKLYYCHNSDNLINNLTNNTEYHQNKINLSSHQKSQFPQLSQPPSSQHQQHSLSQHCVCKIFLIINLIQTLSNNKINYNKYQKQQIIKYINKLKNQNQIKMFLNDLLCFNHNQSHHQNINIIVNKIYDNEIQENIVKEFIQKKKNQKIQNNNDKCIQKEHQHFVKVNKITKQSITEISQELLHPFNPAQFLVINNKDPFVSQIQQMSHIFNKKIRYIKNLLEQNLNKYTLKFHQKIQSQQYIIPSKHYIFKLNKQQKLLKKNLSILGLLPTIPTSNTKIISSKLIQHQPFSKNCIIFTDRQMTTRYMNQLKIRASKKLKISVKRIGLGWYMEKKNSQNNGQGYSHIDKFLLNNVVPDITVAMVGYLKDGNVIRQMNYKQIVNKIGENNHLSSNLSSYVNSLHNSTHHIQKRQLVKIYLIPYDINHPNSPFQNNYHHPIKIQPNPINNNNNPIIITNKKQHQIPGNLNIKTVQIKQKQKHPQTVKLKILTQKKHPNGQQKILGYLQITTNQVSCQHLQIQPSPIIIVTN